MRIVGLMLATVVVLVSPAWAQFRDEAQKCFDPAPRPPEMTIRFCTSAIDSGRTAGAGLPAAYANRGHAYHAKGQLEPAVQDYTESLRLNPTDARVYFSRGVAYLKLGRDDRAFRDLSESLTRSPNDALAHYYRGVVAWRVGQVDQALRDYDAAIRLDPRQAAAYAARGDVYRVRGDRARAVRDYDQALGLNANERNAYLGRGLSHFDLGQFAEAVPDLTRAAELDPAAMSTALYLYLALEYQRKDGRPALAAFGRGDLTRWPGPAVALYLQKMKPDAVLAAVPQGTSPAERVQRCQANFYVGHEMLLRGKAADAARLFQAAVATGVAGLDEYESARAHLKRLGH